MNRIYKLKSWYTVSEAANRLGASIGEKVSVEDMINLVLERHLRICWFMRHVSAQSVAMSSMLCGGGLGPPLVLPNGEKQETLVGVPGWYSVDDSADYGPTKYLEGPHYLELDLNGALEDWLLSIAMPGSPDSTLMSLNGFYVSDMDGGMWSVLEYLTDKEILGQSDPMWIPRAEYPPFSELAFRRVDIEAFERSLIEVGSETSYNVDTPEFAAVIEVWEEYWADGKPGIQKDALILELREKGFTTPSAKAIDRVSRPVHAREGRRSKKQ